MHCMHFLRPTTAFRRKRRTLLLAHIYDCIWPRQYAGASIVTYNKMYKEKVQIFCSWKNTQLYQLLWLKKIYWELAQKGIQARITIYIGAKKTSRELHVADPLDHEKLHIVSSRSWELHTASSRSIESDVHDDESYTYCALDHESCTYCQLSIMSKILF
jgi:hypothetical protein